ncbi:MAG: hypothetical protein HRT35_24320 [Algicola sp.]|nr:hypothetical protein [Algicola sp.]
MQQQKQTMPANQPRAKARHHINLVTQQVLNPIHSLGLELFLDFNQLTDPVATLVGVLQALTQAVAGDVELLNLPKCVYATDVAQALESIPALKTVVSLRFFELDEDGTNIDVDYLDSHFKLKPNHLPSLQGEATLRALLLEVDGQPYVLCEDRIEAVLAQCESSDS